jgi:hypothetical protein
MIYVTDAVGYLGSVSLTLYKDLGGSTSWLEFIIWMGYVTSILCAAAFVFAALYFARRLRPAKA